MKNKGLLVIFVVVMLLGVSIAHAEAKTVYQVKTGDTLGKIANQFGISVNTLASQNNISNPAFIYIGQRLVIPTNGGYNGGFSRIYYTYYTVKPGDILWNIAQKYDTTVEKLVKLNNIRDARDMYVGRRIIVEVKEIKEISRGYQYHTIKPGDTLWNIARKYNTTVRKLVELNDIKYAGDMYIGRRLIVAVNNNDNNNNNNNNNAAYYTVKPGDTLWEIARKFNISVKKLVVLNNIEDARDMYIGRRLLVKEIETDPFYYFYTVKENDKVKAIAKKFSISPSELLKANKVKKKDIKAGDALIIPLDKSSKFSYLKWAGQKVSRHYQVVGDETLAEIAKNYNVPEEVIRKINDLKEDQQIRKGQKLLMPVNSAFFDKHKLYEVKGEEYLFDVAIKHSVTIKSVLKANYLRDPNMKLNQGTILLVALDENSKTTWYKYDREGMSNYSWFK